MKKTLLSIIAFATMASAQYTTFNTQTGYGSNCQEAFFGTLEDWSQEQNKILKSVASGTLNGLSAGSVSIAKGLMSKGALEGASGAGIGLIIGMLDPLVMSAYEDQKFIEIKKCSNGELKSTLFIGDKHPSLTKQQIHQIIKG